MNVYSQNPTVVEEVTLHNLQSLSVVPAKSQGLHSLLSMTLIEDFWQMGHKTQTVAF
jgi:hypothetical protein